MALWGIASLRRIAALLISAVSIALGVPEVNIVGHNLSRPALVAVIVLPVAKLQPTFDNRHAALAEILADEFSGIPPSNAVNKICFLFSRLIFEIAVTGHGEAGHRKAGLCTTQFRVAGQSAHDNDLIQHRFPPPVLPRH